MNDSEQFVLNLDEKAADISTPESVEVKTTQQENVLRRHIKESPKRTLLARHKVWMDGLQHEYPMPYVPYKIGVYIRYFNQTKYKDYLNKHIQQFKDDIGLCPNWTLVDFYIDRGQTAPGMEYSKEWCRLLDDCAAHRVNLIVTQKVSNVSSDPEEMAFVARMLAAQKPPVGIYFISEDIFTLASYYTTDLTDRGFLPEGWEVLPPDELDDLPMLPGEKEEPTNGDMSVNDTGGGEEQTCQN